MNLTHDRRARAEWAAVYRRRPVRCAPAVRIAHPDWYKDQTRLARIVELALGIGLILAALLLAGHGLPARATQSAPRAERLTPGVRDNPQLKLFDAPAERQGRGTRRARVSRRGDRAGRTKP